MNKQIILVDDHVIIRNGLKELIEKLGPYKIMQEFDSGQAFLDSLPEVTGKCDLVIMDISMPEMSGDEVIRQMNDRGVNIPILVLTLAEHDDLIVKLFRMGVRGYLKKNCTAVVMKEALNEIFIRGFYHNEFLTYSLKNNQAVPKKSEKEVVLDRLTARERDFLKWTCHEEEYTYVQMADKMQVSLRTVDGYRESIFEKFGIKSKAGLVLFVLRYRLFDSL
jgi:two-component system invasion response regulator UvrY